MSLFKHIKGKGKPLKVVAIKLTDEADTEELTPGKEYTVTGYFDNYYCEVYGWGCEIDGNTGKSEKLINEKNDFEVVGGSWVVTERAPE